MARISNKEVKEVFEPGPGLAFIVYPEVVSTIPGSQFWAVLFFLMLITLALGSIFGAFETVMTALSDQWPVLRAYKPQLVLATSLAMLVLGLPFTSNGGIHMFTLFDASAPSWNLLLFALLEVVLVSWVYGVDTFLDNMAEMNINLSRVTRFYWKISWKYTTPCILTILLIFSWRNFGNVKYKDEIYPVWVQILGYLITGRHHLHNIVTTPFFLSRLHPACPSHSRSLRGPGEVQRHHQAGVRPLLPHPAVGTKQIQPTPLYHLALLTRLRGLLRWFLFLLLISSSKF